MADKRATIGTGRLEAFSDGVIAIIITVMVLQLKVPAGNAWHDLAVQWPTLLAYVVSFVYVGIYWNNHHHMIHATPRVSGVILWANLHLLFWMSLIPFVTDWTGQGRFTAVPTAAYGVVLVLTGAAFQLLKLAILAETGTDSAFAKALGRDRKGYGSVLLYAVGIGLSFVSVWAANAVFVAVAGLWLVPDRRMERAMVEAEEPDVD